MASHELAPPDPGQIETYGHLIIQVLVAIVTIWATVRKALQKPENVVKASVVGVVAVPAVPADTTATSAADAIE